MVSFQNTGGHMKAIAALASAALLVAPCLHAQSVPREELVKAMSNLSTMLDTGYYIEGFKLVRGKLPAVDTPEQYAKAFFGSARMASYEVDPWGTPYKIHVSPSDGTYLIVSAGSDRRFEQPRPSQRRASTNTEADVVLRNGEFIQSPREWVFAQLKAIGFDPVSALEAGVETSKINRTTADAHVISTAVEAWATDHKGEYPSVSTLDALEKEISPNYVRTMPRVDAWGTEYRYVVAPDRKSYAIVSAGSDRKFEQPVPTQKQVVTDSARDLVISKGELVQQWQLPPAKQDLQKAFAILTAHEMRLQALRNGSRQELESVSRTFARTVPLPFPLPPPKAIAGSRDDALNAADQAVRAGDVLTAFRTLRDVQSSDPTFDDPARVRTYLKAFSSWQLERPEPPAEQTAEGRALALAVLQPFLARHPEEDSAVRAFNELLMKTGQSDQAISFLKGFVDKRPQDERAIVLLSEDLANEGRFDEALQFLDQHPAAFSDRVSLVRAQTNVMLDANRGVDAIELARKLVAAEPNGLQARLLLGEITLWAALRHKLPGVTDADVVKMIATSVAGLKRVTAKEAGDAAAEVYLQVQQLLEVQANYESDSAKKAILKVEAEQYKRKVDDLVPEH